MSNPATPEFNPLSKLVSLIALLASGLYFTGWIYRWTYFSFFHLQITTLNFSVESFYLASFQALFGTILTFLRTFIILMVTILAILISLKLLQITQRELSRFFQRFSLNLSSNHLGSLNFLASLLDELIIIAWFLITLFVLAQWQGETDAFKDAVNETSTLPIITAIMSENSPLGRKLDNPLLNTSQFRIIGDQTLYENLLGKELTNTAIPQKRVWRLLIDQENYLYIFPALPEKNRQLSVPLIALYKRDNATQSLILTSLTSE